MSGMDKNILQLSSLDKEDVKQMGDNAVIISDLVHAGFTVPEGFVISQDAYFAVLKENKLILKIKQILSHIDESRPETLLNASYVVKKNIMEAKIPKSLLKSIYTAYNRLGGILHDLPVTIQASYTDEFLKTPLLNESSAIVWGDANLLIKIKEIWASLFEARAISYRLKKNNDFFSDSTAVIVQQIIKAEKSGSMYTVNSSGTDKAKIIITALYGHHKNIKLDQAVSDHYEVSKKDMLITKKQITIQDILVELKTNKFKEKKLSEIIGKRQKLSDREILALSAVGKKLEHHFYLPYVYEWKINNGKIYIGNIHPVTPVESGTFPPNIDQPAADTSRLHSRGTPASPGIASGNIKIIKTLKDVTSININDVLVFKEYHSDLIKLLDKASAIIIDSDTGIRDLVLAARKRGIPAVVGKTSMLLTNGQLVTVNGTKGLIIKGSILQSRKLPLKSNPSFNKTATKIFIDLSKPDIYKNSLAFNADGVGLLHADSMMSDFQTHPKSLMHNGNKSEYVKLLAQQLEPVIKLYHPRPVIYCISDLTSDNYRKLLGGKLYEPAELNPVVGYHGAFRHIQDIEVFKLELQVIKYLRNKAGFKNLWLMLPFVRSVKELVEIKKILASVGLHRSISLKIWLMVATPANVLLLDRYLETGIDGVAISVDYLTMLTLGIDNSNPDLAQVFNTLDDSTLLSYAKVIKTANNYNIPSSIYGKSLSLYPSLIEKLIEWGITAITVTADVLESTRETIIRSERKLIMKKLMI